MSTDQKGFLEDFMLDFWFFINFINIAIFIDPMLFVWEVLIFAKKALFTFFVKL
jgi:hypothetical protein